MIFSLTEAEAVIVLNALRDRAADLDRRAVPGPMGERPRDLAARTRRLAEVFRARIEAAIAAGTF